MSFQQEAKQKSVSAIRYKSHIVEKYSRLTFALKGFLISILIIIGIVELAAEKLYEGVK